VISLGFGLGKQFPGLLLNPSHLVQQAITKVFLAPLARLHDGLSNMALVAQQPCRGYRNTFRHVS
jgi:hypothetical protein